MHKPTRGFTLIELLVVIAIIGILSAVILAALNIARLKAYDAQRLSDLRTVQNALELYANDHAGSYPTTGSVPPNFNVWYSACNTSSTDGLTNKPPTTYIPNLVSGGYISTLPLDPQMNASADTCCYAYASNGTDYKFMTGFNCATANNNFNNPNPVGSETHSLLDPALDGGSDPSIVDSTGGQLPGAAWAVYSPGAASW